MMDTNRASIGNTPYRPDRARYVSTKAHRSGELENRSDEACLANGDGAGPNRRSEGVGL